MPPRGSSNLADVEIATIPFHVTFQQLVNLLATDNNSSVARLLSECQKRTLTSDKPNETTTFDYQVLNNLNLSVDDVAVAQRSFVKIDTEKLARRVRAMPGFSSSSPGRGFDANAGS